MNTDLNKLNSYLRIRYPAEISSADAAQRFSEEFIGAAKRCGLLLQSDYLEYEPATGLEVYVQNGRMFVYDDNSEDGGERREIPRENLEAWRIEMGALVSLLGEKLGAGIVAKLLDPSGFWDLGHIRAGAKTVHVFLSILPNLHKHYSLLKNLDKTGVSKIFIISTEETPFHPADVPEGIELLSLDEAFGVVRGKMVVNPDNRLLGRMNALYQDVEMDEDTGEVTLKKKSLGTLDVGSAGYFMFRRLLRSYGRIVPYVALSKDMIDNGMKKWKSRDDLGWCQSVKSKMIATKLSDIVDDFLKPGKTKGGEKGYKICDLESGE